MIKAMIEAMYNDPKMVNALAITLRYHIPRADAFLEVCGMGPDGQIQDWIFNNWEARSGQRLLTSEFRDQIRVLHERGAKIKVIGAEDVLDLIDEKRMRAGKAMGFSSFLKYAYPPKLSLEQYNAMSKEQQDAWAFYVESFIARVDSEAKGVAQIKNKTYWAPKVK